MVSMVKTAKVWYKIKIYWLLFKMEVLCLKGFFVCGAVKVFGIILIGWFVYNRGGTLG